MKKRMFFVFIVILNIGFLACKKDKMPENDGKAIDKSTLYGDWEVTHTNAYLIANVPIASLGFNPEELLKEKLFNESVGRTLRFQKDTVYSIYEGEITQATYYYLNKDTLFLEKPYLIGTHYTPYFYLKRYEEDEDKLTIYLKKEESLDLINHDNHMSALEKGLIKNLTEDAQCEIFIQKTE